MSEHDAPRSIPSTGLDPSELAEARLFAGLDGPTLAQLAATAHRRHVVDGADLYVTGEPAASLFLVERGHVALRATEGGHSTIVMTAGPGEVLGWSALRPEARWMTTGRAVGAVEAVELPAAVVFDLATSGSEAGRRLTARLLELAAQHLHETQAQLLRSGREGTITAG